MGELPKMDGSDQTEIAPRTFDKSMEPLDEDGALALEPFVQKFAIYSSGIYGILQRQHMDYGIF